MLKTPTGTDDILPEQVGIWQFIEETARKVFHTYGYKEIRTPLFEYLELFKRSTGESTEIVQKQMYTIQVQEPDEKPLALRPEMTPSIARAIITNQLYKGQGFFKLYYIGPFFRRERPQKGRLRQFYQIGAEAIGSSNPLLDVETILLYLDLLRALKLTEYELRVNSIGCIECRPRYREALKKAIKSDLQRYCTLCQERFDRNPLRILDCKTRSCRGLISRLPLLPEYLCQDCRSHIQSVYTTLAQQGVKHVVDPMLVRGLDYYSRTVYEVQSPLLGSQNAICGGGRYDYLLSELGGPRMGAVGFASGVERLVMALGAQAKADQSAPVTDFYVMYTDKIYEGIAFGVMQTLRSADLSGDMEFNPRSLKAQMRTADRHRVRFAIIIGDEEMRQRMVKVKDMSSGSEELLPQEDVPRYIRMKISRVTPRGT
jgi:histidyl-tRNA synthetase